MNYTELFGVLILLIIGYKVFQNKRQDSKIFNLSLENAQLKETTRDFATAVNQLQEEVGQEREKNRSLLSQKKSSETRLGQISEHLIPFLENCQHDPKNMHFLGNPIDYVVFDFDEGAITFLEVKSGNSKASKRQKTVKNIIKSGRVYYEEVRINEKGVRNRVVGLDGSMALPLLKEEETPDGQD